MKAIFSYFSFRPSNNGSLVSSESLPTPTPPIPTSQLERRIRTLLLLAALPLLFAACTGRDLGASDEGWSPVVAAEGMVYVGTIKGQVLALKDSGNAVSLQWTFPANEEDFIDGVYNSPVVGPDMVYVAALNGTLYALDKLTGILDWSVVVGDVSAPASLVGGPVLSPDNTTVLVGSEDSNLYAYDAKTGSLRRGYPFEEPQDKIWSTPVVKDGVVYFGGGSGYFSRDDHLYAVDIKTGEEKWKFKTGDSVNSSPAVLDGVVYFGSWDKYLYAVDIEAASSLGKEEKKRRKK